MIKPYKCTQAAPWVGEKIYEHSTSLHPDAVPVPYKNDGSSPFEERERPDGIPLFRFKCPWCGFFVGRPFASPERELDGNHNS